MDKNRIIVYVTLMIFVLALLFGNLGGITLTVLALAALLVILWAKRAYFYFVRANRIYSAKDRSRYPQAMAYYKKTLRAGISPKYTVLTATILIQEGEAEAGQAALEKLIRDRYITDEAIKGQAKSALSLIYYMKKDYEEAARLCEEVMKTKYRDNVLYINLCTYYLALDHLKSFRKVVEEFSSQRVTSPALLDLQVVYHMLSKDFPNAFAMEKALFEKVGRFTFADPYVHMAQLWIHYGKTDEALQMLRRAIEDVEFRPVTIMSRDFVQTLIDRLEDEQTRAQALADIDSDPLSIINGWLPQPARGRWIPAPEAEFEEACKIEIAAPEEEILDDKEPETELTEEDEKWLEAHKDD